MNVANLDLCKTLHELSGWTIPEDETHWSNTVAATAPEHYELWPKKYAHADIPAYPLGYLLRKLPLKVKDEYQGNLFGVHLKQTNGSGWIIWYGEIGKDTEMYFNSADSPENAACKLAIELFKRGILK